jgi:hypothetical protein
MKFSTKRYFGDTLFEFTKCNPLYGAPDWMDLRFRPIITGSEFTGMGIYACCYEGKLIYLGKYLGKKTDSFQGDVISFRWVKHISTLTLRGRNLSFSKKALTEIDESEDNIIGEQLVSSDEELITRDRGMLSTFNRYSFAKENWHIFSHLTEQDLKKFEFIYVKLIPDETLIDKGDQLRLAVSKIEDKLVSRFKPRCNAVTNIDSSPSEIVTNECVEKGIQEELINEFSNLDKENDSNEGDSLEDKKEPEDSTAEASFLEWIDDAPDSANSLIKEIASVFENTDLEIHYSFVPDLRVRAFNKVTERSQNILRIQWQPRKQRFLCDCILPKYKIAEELNPVDYDHGPLPTQFTIEMQPEAIESKKVIELIKQAEAYWNR